MRLIPGEGTQPFRKMLRIRTCRGPHQSAIEKTGTSGEPLALVRVLFHPIVLAEWIS